MRFAIPAGRFIPQALRDLCTAGDAQAARPPLFGESGGLLPMPLRARSAATLTGFVIRGAVFATRIARGAGAHLTTT
jgi:hypothetical protein